MSPLKSKLVRNSKPQASSSDIKSSAEKALESVVSHYPPVWKNAFTLSQNVRFTRTPEIEIIRRRIEIDPDFADRLLREQQAKLTNSTTCNTIFAESHSITEPISVATSNMANDVAVAKDENGGGKTAEFAYQLNEEPCGVGHDRLASDESFSEQFPISDYAFFELNGLFGADAEKVATLPKAYDGVRQPHKQVEKSITDLFRVLECRFPDRRLASDEVQTEPVANMTIKEAIAGEQAESTTKPIIFGPVRNEEAAEAFDGKTPVDSQSISPLKPRHQNSDQEALRAFGDQPIIEDIEPNGLSAIIDPSTNHEALVDSGEGDTVNNCSQKAAKLGNDAKAEKLLPPIIRTRQMNQCASLEEHERHGDDGNSGAVDSSAAPEPAVANALDANPVLDRVNKPIAVTPRYAREFQAPLANAYKVKRLGTFEFPSVEMLQQPALHSDVIVSQETLERSAGLLESVLEDFGIKGEIIHVRPGPVVTLYEFEPAAGVKSSRVIGLSDDIARSMSAVSTRVAVIPGRNVIGIELPNQVRETVYLRELIETKAFQDSHFKLSLALGKNIGGEPVIAELAKMPHLLVAGTTGSGKSVAINTMILSLLYRMTPEQCRLIMVDPKMLELSIYDGIPHLLTPVVTDPKKAVTALKWAVREMEDRYRKMAKLGVRNIDGFNARISLALERGEVIQCNVQAGFDKETGELLYQQEEIELVKLPYIVVIVDEMADLMMVAGKEIESAIQRLAQMARAAGIHLIMATQRPSVDVITGTIKANFPTRISFQVTSKIDSRTILGEQGAETLLGQGDMLHMAGGGRIVRVHGPFVSDEEVEKVVAHLKAQGTPDYLANVTDNSDDEDTIDEADSVAEILAAGGSTEDGEELYLQAVKVVMRDKKCSTSYIQRRLGIGYNKAASLVERMEEEGIVGEANHVGKREILLSHRS